jgi:hypothetical protein
MSHTDWVVILEAGGVGIMQKEDKLVGLHDQTGKWKVC